MAIRRPIVDTNGILTELSDTDILYTKSRNYSAISLANNTARTPSTTQDIQVIISFQQVAAILQTATVIVQVDNSGAGTYTTIGTASNSPGFTVTLGLIGGSFSSITPITFIVPKGSQYRYVTSGSGTTTVTAHTELAMQL